MTSTFNPYREWLNLDIEGRTPNHYELLDVQRDVTDELPFREAADRRMAKVRRCRPGNYMQEWTALLDQIDTAKNCLADTRQRRAYDEQLENQEIPSNASPKPDSANEFSSNCSADQTNPAYPPGFGGNSPNSMQNGSTTSDTGDTEILGESFFTDTEETDEDWYPYDPDNGFLPATANNSPTLDTIADISQETSQDLNSTEVNGTDVTQLMTNMADPSMNRGKVAWGAMSGRKRHNISLTIIGFCVSIFLLSFAVGLVTCQRVKYQSAGQMTGSHIRLDSTEDKLLEADRMEEAEDKIKEMPQVVSDVTVKDEPNPTSEMPLGENGTEPATKQPGILLESPQETERVAKDNAPHEYDEPSVPLLSSEEKPTEEEKRRFNSAIDQARLQLGKRDFPAVESQLVRAEKLSRSKEQHETLDRYRLLQIYVDKFWEAVSHGMKELDRVGDFQVKSTYVSVIASDEQKISIRVAGENRTYHKLDLPSGLAMAIAKQWLDPANSVNKIVEGAFLAVDPNANDELARTVWEDASREGEDMKELLLILDRLRPVE